MRFPLGDAVPVVGGMKDSVGGLGTRLGEIRDSVGGSGTRCGGLGDKVGDWGQVWRISDRVRSCCSPQPLGGLRQPWGDRGSLLPSPSAAPLCLCVCGAGGLHTPPVPHQEHPRAPAAAQAGGNASQERWRSSGRGGEPVPGCARLPAQAVPGRQAPRGCSDPGALCSLCPSLVLKE